MIPRFKPALGLREIMAALRPPRPDDVERFEGAFARKMGQKHAIAFPYGRTGLVMLLEALGLKDKEIICPAYTCVVVPHAIVTSGNVPVFVDSQEEDFNMNLDLVPEAINEKTGAIIATSIFGYPVDLDKLDAIRQKYPKIPIIQDCAHSFAAEWKGRPVQREGVAAIYGLNISKLITSIFGGMVTTDDDALAEKLISLRSTRLKPASFGKSVRRLLYLLAVYPAFWGPIYGVVNQLDRSGLLRKFTKYYDDNRIDMPPDYLEMLTQVESRVGKVQVEKYCSIIENRRFIADVYNRSLNGIKNLKLPPIVEGSTYSHYVPRVKHKEIILSKGLTYGIQLGWLIEYCVPQMGAYRRGSKICSSFSISKKMADTTINLPMNMPANDKNIKKIIKIMS